MLGEFLKAQLGSTAPGNCSTMAGDWCVLLGHPDFVAPWRGITDLAESLRVSADAGGLAVLWQQGIGEGLPRASKPYQPGDIGVVTAHGHEAGAIFTGEKWALRFPRGLTMIAAEDVAVIAAWRP